ncbi:MAG: hypothetical protein AAB696_00195 [Patescibacteria group bacterium]
MAEKIEKIEKIKATNECGVEYLFERRSSCGHWLSDKIVKISSFKPKPKSGHADVVPLFITTEDE